MMFTTKFTTLFAVALATFRGAVEALPLEKRDVVNPDITSPAAGDLWVVGSTQTVTWYASSTTKLYTLIVHSVVLLADVDEHGRLDIQHEMLKAKMGGLFWPSDRVRGILAPRPEGSEPPAVLDIGTGSGTRLPSIHGPRLNHILRCLGGRHGSGVSSCGSSRD